MMEYFKELGGILLAVCGGVGALYFLGLLHNFIN